MTYSATITTTHPILGENTHHIEDEDQSHFYAKVTGAVTGLCNAGLAIIKIEKEY